MGSREIRGLKGLVQFVHLNAEVKRQVVATLQSCPRNAGHVRLVQEIHWFAQILLIHCMLANGSNMLFMLLKHKRCLESRNVLPDADWQSRECRYPGHARHMLRVIL